MRTNSIALSGLVATVFASSLGCFAIDLVQKAKASRTTTFEVPIPESGQCNITTENGRVECIAGNVGEIQVEAQITANAKTIEKAQELVDQITVDRYERNGVAVISANIPRGISGSVSLTVTLPADTDLNIETSNGRIEVVGVTSGTTARTTNGAIQLEECTGQIEAKSSNGSITIDGDLLKEVNAMTSNGAVRIEGKLSPGNHRVRTSNGRISLETSGRPVRFVAETSNGKIRANGKKVKSGRTVTLGGENDSEGQSDEKIARIALETSNGSITVEHKDANDDDDSDEDEDDEEEEEDEDEEDEDDDLPIGAAILKELGL